MSGERVEGCPCGRTGDDCEDLVDGLSSIDNALDENCFASGFDKCFIFEDEATCVCKCGHIGDLCEEQVLTAPYNYVLGFVLASVVIILFSALAYKKYKRSFTNPSSEYEWPKEVFVTSDFKVITPKVLFVWRLLMALFFWPILINGIDRAGGIIFFAFTYWNWVMFGIVFTLGTYLSYRKIKGKTEDKEPAGRLENIYLVLLEVEFASSILIAVVVWALLFPQTKATGNEEAALNFNSYMVHGVNVLVLFIEMYINKLHFNFSHYPFIIIWAASYGLYHIGIMFVRDVLSLDHCPVYGFMDMSNVLFLAFILGLLIGFQVFYVLAFYIIKAKKYSRGYTYQYRYRSGKASVE